MILLNKLSAERKENEIMTITDYDKNGTQITDDDINRWSDAADNLDFSQFEDVSDCIYGKLTPISEDKTTISFTLPVSVESDLSNLADKQHCSKSDLLRSFVFDGLLRASV